MQSNPLCQISSWLRCHLWMYTESRGTLGEMDARTTLSEIIPFRLPRHEEVMATVGEANCRSSS